MPSHLQNMERNRRANEAKDDEYARLMQLEKVASYAKWENDTDAKLAQAREADSFKQMKNQAANDLNRRRHMLAKLYTHEMNLWKHMIESSKETPDIVKAKIREKAEALKAKREFEQQEYVEAQRRRQWRDGCDDLRQLDSQATLNDVAQRRSEQLEEKSRQQLQELEDEAQWSTAWDVDRKKKEIRERNDLAQAHKRNVDMKRDLDIQVMQRKEKAVFEREQTRYEAEDTQARWDAEKQAQDEHEANVRAAMRQQGKEVLQYNNERQQIRHLKAQEEMENDLVLLQVALEKERQELEDEETKRREEKEASQIYQKHLQQQMIKEKQDDSMLEELRRQDEEAATAKRDAQKAREDSARVKLAAEVQRGREQQKQSRIRQMEEQRVADADYAASQRVVAKQMEDQEMQLKAVQRKARLDNQRSVRLQVQEKVFMFEKSKQDEYLQNRRNQHTEKEFQKTLMTFAGQTGR